MKHSFTDNCKKHYYYAYKHASVKNNRTEIHSITVYFTLNTGQKIKLRIN